MKAMRHQAGAGRVLAAVTAGLAGLAEAASTPEGQLALISELEELKAAACAAQAVVTARFAAVRRAEQPARAPGHGQVDVIGRSIAAELGLARRVSPHQAARLVGLARVLVEELPHTLAALQAGVLTAWRATLIARETATLSRAHRADVDAQLCADPERIRGWGIENSPGRPRRPATASTPRAPSRGSSWRPPPAPSRSGRSRMA
jgi:hypothetical protein